jgi:hypothetical protein
MTNYFIKRVHNAGLIVLICMLLLCGIYAFYAVYAYQASTGNSQQAHTTSQGLLVMAHHIEVSMPTGASKPEPVQQAAPPLQQPVGPPSVFNKSEWENYIRRLHHLP